MKRKDFENLLQGTREMKAILAGKAKPAYRRTFARFPVKDIRSGLKLTQAEFAKLLDIPVTTLRNWEQGRTNPHGPARALLVVAQKRPDAVLEALHE
jgi:putative transcriptional regulator